MKLSRLLKCLEFYIPDNSVFLDSEITGIKLLEENQKNFSEDILYIGTLSSLNHSMDLRGSLFLVKDCDRCIEASGNIAIFSDVNIFTLFNKVQDIFIAQSKRVQKEAVLLHSLIDGKDLRYIIRLGCDILKNPLLLTDSSLKLIEYGYYKEKQINDKLWNDIVIRGYCSYEYVSSFKENKIIDRINNSGSPVLLQEDFSKEVRRVIGRVELEGKCIAYLAVLECDNLFTNEDIDLIGLLCEALSTELKKDNRIRTTKGLMYESLLFDLIEGKIKDKCILIERLKCVDWNVGNRLRLIVVDLNSVNEKNHYMDYLKSYVEELLIGAKSVYYEDKLLILVDCNKYEKMLIVEKFKAFLEENEFKAGVSAEFSSLLELKEKYIQSKRALAVGWGLYKNSFLYDYEKLKLYDLLKAAGEKVDLIEFCPNPLIRLNNYDKENDTDYMNTLQTYLYCNKNKADAAKKLFLHRNSLNYRINKIKEIIGIEFEDFKEQYYLYLGFKIIKLLEEKRI